MRAEDVRAALRLTLGPLSGLQFDQTKDNVAVAFTRPTHGPKALNDGGVKPNESLASSVKLWVVADGSERERGGNRLEGGFCDADADHAKGWAEPSPIGENWPRIYA